MLPKNSGLEKYRANLEQLPNNKIIVRAEDVPLFIDKLGEKGINCIGVTGEDLFSEYKLNNVLSKTKVIQKILWEDKNAMFNKPAICLLGKKPLSEITNSKVAINKKYSRIAESFLTNFSCEKIYFNGCTETAAETNLADYVIDIVYSGSSAKEAGLTVLEKLFSSDVVMVGK